MLILSAVSLDRNNVYVAITKSRNYSRYSYHIFVKKITFMNDAMLIIMQNYEEIRN